MIDGGIGLDIRIAEHTTDVTCVDFNDEVADANEMKALRMEHVEEAIKFELGLRVSRLALVP